MMAWLRTASIVVLLATAITGMAMGAAPGKSHEFVSADTTGPEQITIDCNILFQNNPNCPTGESPVGCVSDPYTTCELLQTTFPNNRLGVDPEFDGDVFHGVTPNFRVEAGGNSTLLGGAVIGQVPNDGFFEQAYFIGAMGPSPNEDWTKKNPNQPLSPTNQWTYWSPDGAGRADLPNPANAIVVPAGNITVNTTWNSPLGHKLGGVVRVQPPATLTIAAGTVVFGSAGIVSALIIEQGAKIMANGTAQNPIIFTSEEDPGLQDRGDWSGVVINGRAPVNCAAVLGGTCEGEGGSGTYGGNLPNDDSGVIRYTRIEFAGREFSTDNELNALTLNGVGNGTDIDHVQAHRGFDDGIETFGGTVDLKYAIADECGDDNFDFQVGWRGRIQFGIVRQSNDISTADKGIESDNYEFGFNNAPRTNFKIFNTTYVGPGAGVAGGRGIHLRRGSAGTIANSIVFNFRTQGIDLDDVATFNNCPGPPVAPIQVAVDEPQDAPVRTLAVNQHPNPFNPSTQIDFVLPQDGVVRLGVYDATGRLIDNLVAQHLRAGSHSFEWHAPEGSASGAYFYRVETNGQVVNGKMHLVK
jgi:hypothetical protein